MQKKKWHDSAERMRPARRLYNFILIFAAALAMNTAIPAQAREASVTYGSESYEAEQDSDFNIGVYIRCDAPRFIYDVTMQYDPSKMEYRGGADAGGDGIIRFVGESGENQRKYMLIFRALEDGASTVTVTEATVIEPAAVPGGENGPEGGAENAAEGGGPEGNAAEPVVAQVTYMASAPVQILPKPGAEELCRLKSLTISEFPDFVLSPEIYEYELTADAGTEALHVAAEADNGQASVEISDTGLVTGENTIKIAVRAGDDVLSYTLHVTRPQAEAELPSDALSGGGEEQEEENGEQSGQEESVQEDGETEVRPLSETASAEEGAAPREEVAARSGKGLFGTDAAEYKLWMAAFLLCAVLIVLAFALVTVRAGKKTEKNGMAPGTGKGRPGRGRKKRRRERRKARRGQRRKEREEESLYEWLDMDEADEEEDGGLWEAEPALAEESRPVKPAPAQESWPVKPAPVQESRPVKPAPAQEVHPAQEARTGRPASSDGLQPLQPTAENQAAADSGETVISVQDVSMRFKISEANASSLKEYMLAAVRRQNRYHELVALDHISFEVLKGEVVGIVGTNGSGKSTLLKLVSGALSPTEGKIEVDRKKVQLLTLGTGFDTELTARENVYLNGAIIGYSREFLDEHFNDIVEFAELDGFMDEKIKNFSSGMVSRLGFSIATAGQAAEILILDEVLSVGDMFFRQKSEKRIKEMIHGGSTVLIVSHSMDTILKNCTKVLWIEKGVLKDMGDPKRVCAAYKKMAG